MIRDNSLLEEAVQYLLKGRGEYGAAGRAKSLGFSKVIVKPFGKKAVDVWFYRANDPCNCRSWHVEFGRTGGEMLLGPEALEPIDPGTQ